MEETDKISPKDIYASLWRCRDFEISHLWQRSVFLTAFIVMCFTGYGAVLIELCKVYEDKNSISAFYILNLVALVICLFGFILSILWIMMSKGSKAWYEKYENAIYFNMLYRHLLFQLFSFGVGADYFLDSRKHT